MVSLIPHRPILFVSCLIASCLVGRSLAGDVTIYTEDYPPYNFADTNGVIVGESTDRVRKIMYEAGLSYTIHKMPWVRAEKLASLQPDALIFSMAFSEERSANYDWLAPVAQPDMQLFARKSFTSTVTLELIRQGAFTALCVETDASCNILRRVGFPPENLIMASTGGASEPMMVYYGRANMFLGDLNLHPYRAYLYGLAASEMKPVLAVEDDLTFYLAAGKQVDTRLRERVKDAYERLKKNGRITVFKRLKVPPETARK